MVALTPRLWELKERASLGTPAIPSRAELRGPVSNRLALSMCKVRGK